MPAARVLVVDDHPINLELITLLLEAEGFDVTSASNAEEALAALKARVPDVLVLDVQLPGMSGLDLMKVVRSRPDTCGICAVVVTSYAMEADREIATAAGCDAYFTKPVNTREFAAAIRDVYDRSRQLRSISAVPPDLD
ncbi:MAG TPA: response regulator [Bryobacteraceae bacterium]|nr:response regulator [Bryobacteraceae bacterium]